MSQYDAIIFDLGGVILDLDIAGYRSQMAAAIGYPELGNPMTAKAPQFFYDLERGLITKDQFVAAAKAHAMAERQFAVDEQTFLAAFNSICKGVVPARLDFLMQLRQRYRLFLLSNTNALHAAAFEPMFTAINPERPIASYFDQVFYSHELNERKPDKAAYEAVLARAQLTPEKTVFVDDLEANIIAANALGIRGHHLTGELLDDGELKALLQPL